MKAQIITLDFIITIFILGSFFTILSTNWNMIINTLQQRLEYQELFAEAFTISELLIKNPGYPEDWTISNVEVLGLAKNSNVLSPNKVLLFENMTRNNYATIKEKLGLTEDFKFEIERANDSATLYEAPEINLTYVHNVVTVTRFALLDDEPVKMMISILK